MLRAVVIRIPVGYGSVVQHRRRSSRSVSPASLPLAKAEGSRCASGPARSALNPQVKLVPSNEPLDRPIRPLLGHTRGEGRFGRVCARS